MSLYPLVSLVRSKNKTVVASGPHIHVIDTITGNVLTSTTTLGDAEKEKVVKSGPIRCSALDLECEHIVTAGEDKQLKVWAIDGLRLLSSRELPKRPTKIHLTKDGQTILVSDKFGDIFSYPLHPTPGSESQAPTTEAGASKRGALTSHENPSNGTLVLGHTSLLTSFLLTHDEKYIVSADRDEHIRVSWYPQGFVIERFCLGHTKFVSAIHIPTTQPSVLISGGGDHVLKVWDWFSGECLQDISVFDAIEPFLEVKVVKSKWGGGDGAVMKKGKKKGKGKGRKSDEKEGDAGEGERAAIEGQGEEVAQTSADVVVDEVQTELRTDELEEESIAKNEESDQFSLCVNRISSLTVGDQIYIVFNAVGATALFYFPLPSSPSPSNPSPEIQSLGLGKPVIDFTISEDHTIWALVDGERAVSGLNEETNTNMVRLVRFTESNKMVEVTGDDTPALLTALNTKCIVPATPQDLNTLDLYAPLSSLPKRFGEDSGDGGDADADTGTGTPEVVPQGQVPANKSTRRGKKQRGEEGPTQRELGRLKNKRALEKALEEKAKLGGGGTGEGEGVEEGPEIKRIRSEGREEEGEMDTGA